MSVVVVHPSLNRGGGAEKVCLAVIGALCRRGYRVRLATIDRTDWRFLEERFGELSRPFEEEFLIGSMPIRGKFSQAALTLSLFLPELFYQRMKNDCDLILNTYGELVDSVADISYVNAIPVRVVHHYPESGFSNSIVLRSIAQAYGFSLRAVDKLFRRKVLLTNSTFTQGIVRRHLGRDSLVVYPPVDVERFKRIASFADRENVVATVSRLRLGKNLGLIPRIARLVKKGEFTILGLADQASQEAIEALTKGIGSLGAGDRVRLLINQPPQKLVDVLSSAKVFLHTQPMEAFGMAVVEAMAAGCVPVVPREGGPWFDILDGRQGEFGFSYGSSAEAANMIEVLLEDEDLRMEVSARASERAMAFDSSVFEGKILSVVDEVYSSRYKKTEAS